MNTNQEYSLYDKSKRKYLSVQERKRFYAEAMKQEEPKRLFLLMLYYSGARISEVLMLECESIDGDEKVLHIASLKKRRKIKYRRLPLLSDYLHDLTKYCRSITTRRLWTFSRCTGYRYVAAIMKKARIEGIHACPKGLRHSFGVTAVLNGVPLNKIKKWMGHESITTTEIYLDIVGKEERALYSKMWK